LAYPGYRCERVSLLRCPDLRRAPLAEYGRHVYYIELL